MLYLIIAVVAIVVLAAVYGRTQFNTKSHWEHFIDGLNIDTKTFYKLVEEELHKRKLPKTTIRQTSFLQSHMLSEMRLYLEVSHVEYQIFICAAPYSTGSFFSTWLCIKEESLLEKIQGLNILMGKNRKTKSFYQLDTEAMFRTVVQNAVVNVVEQFNSEKGYHSLTQVDQQNVEIQS